LLAQTNTGGFIFSVGQDGRLIDVSASQGDPDASTDTQANGATGPGDRLFLFSNRSEDEADAETASRTPVPAPPEILAAIEATAIRYAGHPGLRRAGLSVTDWAAL